MILPLINPAKIIIQNIITNYWFKAIKYFIDIITFLRQLKFPFKTDLLFDFVINLTIRYDFDGFMIHEKKTFRLIWRKPLQSKNHPPRNLQINDF
jgi:hypothetical protein